MAASQRHLIPQARALYAQGFTIEKVAEALGVHLATLYRWKAKDKRDWDACRQDFITNDPRATLRHIESALAELAANMEFFRAEPNAYSQTVRNLNSVVNDIRSRFGDVSTVLGALGNLAAYAVEHGTDEERTALAHICEGFLEDLKRRNA